MKLLRYSLFALAPLGTLSAAVHTFEGYTTDASLTTSEPGWTLSETNVGTAPLAYIAPLNSQSAGALGGEFADPVNDSVKLTLDSSLTSPSVSVGFDFYLKDSTNDLPSRDVFGFSLASGSGATIVEMSFLPVAQTLVPEASVAQWQISYLIAGGSTVLTNYVVSEASLYSMNVVFAANGVSITFGNGLGTATIGGLVAGFDAGVNGVGDLSFNWSKATGNTVFGDGSILFDNINIAAVPEPSAALLSGLASLLLLKRRRH